MANKHLPFSDTEVSADRSQTQIIGSLRELGFDRIAQFVEGQEYMIIAQYKGATFRFQVQLDKVITSLRPAKITRGFDPTKLRAKAERIAWRLMAEQVKASCDMIKYEVCSIGRAFGGNLMVTAGGAPHALADIIIADVEAGRRPGVALLENLSK